MLYVPPQWMALDQCIVYRSLRPLEAMGQAMQHDSLQRCAEAGRSLRSQEILSLL